MDGSNEAKVRDDNYDDNDELQWQLIKPKVFLWASLVGKVENL